MTPERRAEIEAIANETMHSQFQRIACEAVQECLAEIDRLTEDLAFVRSMLPEAANNAISLIEHQNEIRTLTAENARLTKVVDQAIDAGKLSIHDECVVVDFGTRVRLVGPLTAPELTDHLCELEARSR